MRSPAQAEEAIEHMCFLTDAHHLYKNALGLYDLELTLLVAQQAQKVMNTSHNPRNAYIVYILLIMNRIRVNTSPSYESSRHYQNFVGNLKSTTIWVDRQKH